MSKPKIYTLKLKDVYPHYITKVTKKGRTTEELEAVFTWLTGYSKHDLYHLLETDISFEQLFLQAPQINKKAPLITGVICGIRVEDIEDTITQQIRYLDKVVDELAKGKSLDKIFRIKK